MRGIWSMRRLALAGSLAGVVALPGYGRASTLDISSSVSGFCIGMDCSLMRFVVDLSPSQGWIDRIRIVNDQPSVWQFESLWGVNDAWTGANLGWSGEFLGNDLLLYAPGAIGDTPLWVTVRMATWGSGYPSNGLSFGGADEPFNTNDPGEETYPPNDPPTSGEDPYDSTNTATPEPASMLLLGTGLAGVAGAARRRRAAKEGHRLI